MGTPAQDALAAVLVDDADRRYVETLPSGLERETVVASLTRYRAPDVLLVGDAMPEVTARRADDLVPIGLPELVQRRPLLLVFGSFT